MKLATRSKSERAQRGGPAGLKFVVTGVGLASCCGCCQTVRPKFSGTPGLNVLFVCSQNRLRSPTAEQVFASWPGLEVESAGLNSGAVNPLTAELVSWAQLIVVMEKRHASKLRRKFRAHLRQQRVVCVDIPDQYAYMDPALVALLLARVPRLLR